MRFTIQLQSGLQPVDAMVLTPVFDPAVLRLKSLRAGNALDFAYDATGARYTCNKSQGCLELQLGSISTPLLGATDLAELEFDLLADTPTAEICFADSTRILHNGNYLAHERRCANMTVLACSPQQLSACTDATSVTCAAVGGFWDGIQCLLPGQFADLPDLGESGFKLDISTGEINQGGYALQGGISIDGGAPLQNAVLNQPAYMEVTAMINVDPLHVGLAGETLVVILYVPFNAQTLAFMLPEDGVLTPWDMNLNTLLPASPKHPLMEREPVSIFTVGLWIKLIVQIIYLI